MIPAAARAPAVEITRNFLQATIAKLRVSGATGATWTGRVGGFGVTQHHYGRSLFLPLTEALGHASPMGATPSDLVVHIATTEETGVDIGPPIWMPEDFGAMGTVGALAGSGLYATHDLTRASVQILDLTTRTGLILMRSVTDLPEWERSFPLRSFFHWLSVNGASTLVHAGAVGLDGIGALLLGPGGAGKSTTSTACLSAGLSFAGDDFVRVTLDPSPAIHGLYMAAKLDARSTSWLPAFQRQSAGKFDPQIGKNMFLGAAMPEGALCPRLALGALFVLERTGMTQTRIEPSSAGAAFRSMAANTLALLPGDRAALLTRLSQLATAAPTYRLLLGTDLDGVVGAIRHSLQRLPS